MIFSLPSSSSSSLALFCCECGEIWARVKTRKGWLVTAAFRCPAHPREEGEVAGSLIDCLACHDTMFYNQLATVLRIVPLDLLAHEFKVHMAAAEKEMQDDND